MSSHASLLKGNRARLTGGADDAPGGPREADKVLVLAAARARGELGGESRGVHQLQAECDLTGTRLRARAGARRLVEQRQTPAEQVVDLDVRLLGLEEARHRVAGARGSVQCRGARAEGGVAVDRLRSRDREEVAAAFVKLDVQAEEGLEPAAEAAARAAHALRDRADTPPARGVEVQDPVRLAVAQRSQHDGLCLHRARHDFESRYAIGRPAGPGYPEIDGLDKDLHD